MIKAIFIGINRYYAESMNTEVGKNIHLALLFNGKVLSLEGQILTTVQELCGTLVIIRNAGLNSPHHMCCGWPLIPIWISRCGQSGVLTIWPKYNCNANPPTVMRPVDPVLKALLDSLADPVIKACSSPVEWAE